MPLGTLILLLFALPAWTPSPAYLPLFTPRGVPPGTYRTDVTPQPLDEFVSELGAGVQVESVVAGEAFGQSGGYNRWQLARLYGARRVRVARMPRIENGQVVEAWTLVSPYPDPTLRRLEPGTLRIVLHLR